jgi:hypothetical protein
MSTRSMHTSKQLSAVTSPFCCQAKLLSRNESKQGNINTTAGKDRLTVRDKKLWFLGYTGCVYNTCTNFSSPHQQSKETSHQCTPTNSFRGTAPTSARPQFFRLLPVRKLQTPSVFSSNCKWRDASHFRPVKTFATAPELLKRCDNPRWNVPMH